MVKKIYISILVIVLGFISYGQDEVLLPTRLDPVIDYTNTLSESNKNRINNQIRQFSDSLGSQIGVLILATTGELTIEELGLKIAEEWVLGREGIDDGVLLLVAKDDRKMRIEVGYGLEGAIPDIYAKRIIENDIAPRFREGDFDGGISAGVESLLLLIKKEELPEFVLEDETIYVPEDNRIYAQVFYIFLFITILVILFFLIRGWWKNITHFSKDQSVSGKFKYIFVKHKWSFLIYLLGMTLFIVYYAFAFSSLKMGLKYGSVLSSIPFWIYFFIRGFAAGPGKFMGGFFSGSGSGSSSGSSYSSGSRSSYSSSSGSSSSSSRSSSSSYSGRGGSFGGGGASGGW
jgi:uncharacterized protein